MLLTPEQRRDFIAYCDSNITSGKAILEQMKKINLPEAMMLREQVRTACYTAVRADLLSFEQQTIKG